MKNITKNASQKLLHDRKNQDDIINVVTSFDGVWGSRWCSSTNGCMAAVAEEIGKILDVTMLCNHCDECEAWKSKIEIEEADVLQFILSKSQVAWWMTKGVRR